MLLTLIVFAKTTAYVAYYSGVLYCSYSAIAALQNPHVMEAANVSDQEFFFMLALLPVFILFFLAVPFFIGDIWQSILYIPYKDPTIVPDISHKHTNVITCLFIAIGLWAIWKLYYLVFRRKK